MSATSLSLLGLLLLGPVPAAPEAGDSTPTAAARSQTDERDDHDEQDEHDDDDRGRAGAERADEDREDEDRPHAFHLHETMVVTGSAIETPGADLPYAVSVIDRDAMQEQGSPLIVDLMKNLPVSGAVLGEANASFQGFSVGENVVNVNLRSLGASRTLVLLNSRRQVPIPFRLFGGRYVDVNAIPSIAVERIEVLKEGAAAIYGSDAVAGVANFVTRDDFEGLEATLSHEHFDGAGDSTGGFIWGRGFGSAHFVLAAEGVRRSHLASLERPHTIRPRTESRWGWSNAGNPGFFVMPRLGGGETASEFADALSAARGGVAGRDYFVDPACEGLGGFDRGSTCAFRYAQWADLVEETEQTRLFAQLSGAVGEKTEYRFEALWNDVFLPAVVTSPSFPPTVLTDGTQLVSSAHPGRVDFCAGSHALGGFASEAACLEDDWYFFGRTLANSGPGRYAPRRSDTGRLAASLERDLELGGRAAKLDLAVSYSRSTGDLKRPAEYVHRRYLAYRGFGGPNCGVSVVADADAPSGMRLGPTGSAQPGAGGCFYYNPFGSAIEFAEESGAPWRDTPNPGYVPALANDPAMLNWLNEIVDVDSEAEMLVVDATLSGTWIEGRADFAVGYQYRDLSVRATPNDPGNYELNPCVVPGDRSCIDPSTGKLIGSRGGQFTFTSGFYPYRDSQPVHRMFGELSLHAGERGDVQVAANYELHEEVDSFDPKVSARFRLSEGDGYALSLRGSVQTTFRAPSVDDLNENVQSTLAFVAPVGSYKPFDTYGSRDLRPESALTWDVGLVLFAESGLDLTLDYWSYDFEDLIAPQAANDLVRVYQEGRGMDPNPANFVDPVKLDATRDSVVCPGGLTDGSCLATDIERLILRVINWPGVETSGLDFHLHYGGAAGNGALAASLTSSYLLEYALKPLVAGGIEFVGGADAAGYFNRTIAAAPPLPEIRSRGSLGYHWGNYGLVAYVSHIGSYDDRSAGSAVPHIDDWLTADLTFHWEIPGTGLELTLAALNLTDEEPPLVDFEHAFDALTHNPKGRRLKAALTYRLGN